MDHGLSSDARLPTLASVHGSATTLASVHGSENSLRATPTGKIEMTKAIAVPRRLKRITLKSPAKFQSSQWKNVSPTQLFRLPFQGAEQTWNLPSGQRFFSRDASQ